MNTRNLQIHLEKKLSSLASACMDHCAEDDGLICEILSSNRLNDENRLYYICQIECRLPAGYQKKTRSDYDLNSLYQEEEDLRFQKQQRWNKLHKIAVELNVESKDRQEIPKERFYQLVSDLTDESTLF